MKIIKKTRKKVDKIKEIYIISVHTTFCWYKLGTYLSVINRLCTRDLRKGDTDPFIKNGFNHTAILELHTDNTMFIVEAIAKGIIWKTYNEWSVEDKTIRIWKLKTPNKYDIEKAELLLDLFVELKQGYDFKGLLIYQFLFAIGRRINKVLGTNIRWIGYTSAGKAGRRWYCSEFAGFIWCKLKGFFREWYRLDPNSLDKQCSRYFEQVYMGEAKDLIIQDLLKWH